MTKIVNGTAIPEGMSKHAKRIRTMLDRENLLTDQEWEEKNQTIEDLIAEYLTNQFYQALLTADSECSAIAGYRSVDLNLLTCVSRLCRKAYQAD